MAIDTKFLERVVKAPLAAKLGVAAGVAVLLTAANYFAIGVPAFGDSITETEAKIRKVEGEQKKLDADLIEKTAIANNLNQFRREKELLEQKLAEALAELPDQKNLDELLQLFQDRAVKAGLEIGTIEPQAEQSSGFYARIPVPMTASGNYHEIATFFDALGRLRRIVNISDIVLADPKVVNGKVTVNARFLVTTFMFTEKKSGPAVARSGK
ncbi:type IV pilus inner membrane component PilO [Anaeromyxobacter paludicola]|uniref:Pilus assembly protein PilO n=1 Tax=Anaeromyxobacter paludicola TaxID=2918171 RepID=A0ABN6N783_9BACT|nr:type 4a pilus biogenesis protein PilO [Anaeromyxobacter paludicola]BDG09026.1 hypothetical protein AMPC_21390 [Anaeromyxobacter paludicola]